MKVKYYWIISLVISLVLIGILLPIGLTDLITLSNGTIFWPNGTVAANNATIGTLLGVVTPIMIVITLILAFIPRNRED